MDKSYYAELVEKENQLHTDMRRLIDRTLDHHGGKVEYPDMEEIDDNWDYPISMTMEGRKYEVTGNVIAVGKDGDCLYVDLIDRDNGKTEQGFHANEKHYSDILYFLSEADDATEQLAEHKKNQSQNINR